MGASPSKEILNQSTCVDTESGARRATAYASELTSFPSEDATTLYHIFKNSCEKFPKNDFLGTRTFVDGNQTGPYVFETYETVQKKAYALGSAFVNRGFESKECVGIFSMNRPEWAITAEACNAYNLTSVALYSTLGAESTHYIVNHSELKVVVCSAKHCASILAAMDGEGGCPTLKHVVCMDTECDGDVISALEGKGVEFTYIEDLYKTEVVPHRIPDSEDLACIMYTSGTTGLPKGVMLTHTNFCSEVLSVNVYGANFVETDRHFSFLPLAHSFERVLFSCITHCGGKVGFFTGNIPNLVPDIGALKPTVFAGVPRVFNKIHDKVMNGVNAAGGLKKMMFNSALDKKKAAIAVGEDTPIWNSIIFKKVLLKIFGSEDLRFVITGSAPIEPKVLVWLRCVCCCPVVQGYGLTETCAGASVSLMEDPRGDRVGPPISCNEYMLESIPDMEYLSTDKPCPRGEILIRGNNVFKGYFKEPEKTAAVLSEDGWFRTGDVGRLNEDGSYSIIDRKKSIGKLAQGEYVSPSFLMGVYVTGVPAVAQMYVHVESTQSVLVALVCVDPDVVPEDKDREQVKKDILADLEACRKTNKLKGFERIKNLAIVEAFSVENNFMTPTFKLREATIRKEYAEILSGLY